MLLLLAACGPAPVLVDPAASDRAQTGSSGTADHTVDCAGAGDFTTLTEAIAAAASGERIAVAPCTYAESVDFQGKQLEIYATDGPEVTILQGRRGAVVSATSGEPDGTELRGFTLTGGGGAVSVTLSNLRVADLLVDGTGGSYTFLQDGGELEIAGVTVVDAGSAYAVVYGSRGGVVADGLTFTCGSYGILHGHGALFLDHVEADCPGGYSLYTENSTGVVLRSTLVGAVSMVQEDDHYTDSLRLEDVVIEGSVAQTYGSFQLRNSVVVGGVSLASVDTSTAIEASVLTGASCGLASDVTELVVRNTVFWDNHADTCGLPTYVGRDDNLGVDPSFVDLSGGDYRLDAASPLVDAGPGDRGWADPDGSPNDIGAFGGPHSMGGGY